MNIRHFIALFCLIAHQLMCMDNNRLNQDALTFIKSVFDIEMNLEDMYNAKANKSPAADDYWKEACLLRDSAKKKLTEIILSRNITQIDPLSHSSKDFNTPLEDALSPYKYSLEHFFLAQYHEHPQAMQEINATIFDITKKLHHDAQKYVKFQDGFIYSQIQNVLISEYEKKAGLTKSQQHYCVGLYHFYAALYLTQVSKKVLDSCDNYEKALAHFCLSGNQLLLEPWSEIPSHMQMLHKTVSHLLCIKNMLQESPHVIQVIEDNRKFKYNAALLKVSWETSQNHHLWESLSTNAKSMNQALFQQFSHQ